MYLCNLFEWLIVLKDKIFEEKQNRISMNETKNLVQKIVEGIQEKKGKNIVVAIL